MFSKIEFFKFHQPLKLLNVHIQKLRTFLPIFSCASDKKTQERNLACLCWIVTFLFHIIDAAALPFIGYYIEGSNSIFHPA